MKKILLSAAAFAVVAVSAVAVAPTTSEAIPAFARQTGAACLACHHLSFPALNAFGRSFKQGGLTDVGEQTLIEDDMLSLTSAVNFSAVLRPQFVSTTVSGSPVVTANVTTKTVAITADQVLLIGGRVGTNTGTFVEIGFGGPTATGGFANFQLFNSYDIGGFKAGVSIFNSGFGETAGMEVGSTFGQHGGLLGGKTLSASNTLSNNAGGTGGVALFAANEMFTASIAGVTPTGALGGVGNGWKLAPSARVFATVEAGGFELGFGGGITNGTTANAQTAAALVLPVGTAIKMKKWMIDAQIQGEIGDMGFAAYADYASAGAPGALQFNPFAAAGATAANGSLKGYSFRAELKPIHTVVAMAGIGNLKDNLTKTAQWQVGAEYEIYQNFVVALIYNNAKTTTAATGVAVTTKTTTLDIEALL